MIDGINQLPAPQDRPGRPGRKTLNRLKKAKQLMTRRLANQLRQGREHKIIHRSLDNSLKMASPAW